MTLEQNSLAAVLLFGLPLHTVRFGALSVPLIDGGLVEISYKGRAGGIETFSMSDIIEGKIAEEKISGKICILGHTAPGKDDFVTPAGVMSGTEIHANATLTVIAHLRSTRPATGFRINAAATVIRHLRAHIFNRPR